MIFSKEDAANLQGAVVRLLGLDGNFFLKSPPHRSRDLCAYRAYIDECNFRHSFALIKGGSPGLGDIVEVLKWPPGHPLAEMTPERAIEILTDGHPLEEVRREAVECLRREALDDWIDINEAEPFPGQKIIIPEDKSLIFRHWSPYTVFGQGGIGENENGLVLHFLGWKPVRP